ncbi:MAG: 2-oxoglutarate oxidoreductase [Fidelibacterota bacterium]|nr:MAG: 2-oxoglutarate oxidoreductase [Candidatus Neomarinimicrobiota bacterium]
MTEHRTDSKEGHDGRPLPGYELVYERPLTLVDTTMSYCPGCGHSVVHRVLMEVVEELGLQSETIGVASVGCSVFAYDYLDVDMQGAAHGRATATATGIKRMLPDKYVFTYQGDGDLAAIGTAETIHTANRGENILIIFINNGIYGMTGGQMAPTTILGAQTTTTPEGRQLAQHGNPLKIADMIALLPGVAYVTRQSVHKAANVRKLKKAFIKSFQLQEQKRGLCFVEVVSNCPSGWKMTPVEANRWLEEHMLSTYTLGDLKAPPVDASR